MSHETHNEGHQPQDNQKSKTSLSASFWFVLILVFLFIAAVNFVNVMSHDSSEGHGEATHTEATHNAHAPAANGEHIGETEYQEEHPAEGHGTVEKEENEEPHHNEGH